MKVWTFRKVKVKAMERINEKVYLIYLEIIFADGDAPVGGWEVHSYPLVDDLIPDGGGQIPCNEET